MRRELANTAPELRHALPVAEAVHEHDAVETPCSQKSKSGEKAEEACVCELEEADGDALQPDGEGRGFLAWWGVATQVGREVVQVGHAEDEGCDEDDAGGRYFCQQVEGDYQRSEDEFLRERSNNDVAVAGP